MDYYAKLGETIGDTIARNFALNATWDSDASTWQNVDLTLADVSLICPVCMGDVHRSGADASVTVDGQIYHKSCIEQWFEQRRRQRLPVTSPATNLELPSTLLVPLCLIIRAIQVYFRERPEFRSKHIALLDAEQVAALLQAELFTMREGLAMQNATQALDMTTSSQHGSARAEGATDGAAGCLIKQSVEASITYCRVSGKVVANIGIHAFITTFVAMISSSEHWSLMRMFAFVCVELSLLVILYLHLRGPSFVEIVYDVYKRWHLYLERVCCQALEQFERGICIRGLNAVFDLALDRPFCEVRRLLKAWYLYTKLKCNALSDGLNAWGAQVVGQSYKLMEYIKLKLNVASAVRRASSSASKVLNEWFELVVGQTHDLMENVRKPRARGRDLQAEIARIEREREERRLERELQLKRERIEQEQAAERLRQRRLRELNCVRFVTAMRNGDVLGVRDAIVDAKMCGVAPKSLYSGFKRADLERLKIQVHRCPDKAIASSASAWLDYLSQSICIGHWADEEPARQLVAETHGCTATQ